MKVKPLIAKTSALCKRWFHKRNIIIVSEHQVRHIPISGPLQFLALSVMLGGLCWASYSTGSFLAARSALKEQGQALRSVAAARIENGFGFKGTASTASTDNAITAPTTSVALSGLDNSVLVARIAALESKVVELKNTNEEIVHRVQDKTAGRIDELENIIKQTGLSSEELKKQFSENKAYKSKKTRSVEAAGGPYIPSETINLSPEAEAMFTNLDQYAMLNQIVSNLPLSYPIFSAEEESNFGTRIDPFNGHLAFHSGLDFAGPADSRIFSTADGKVISAGRNGAYGNAIDIDHGFGIVTRYGHLSQILVHEGQEVAKGDVIGVQGSTGRATGPHLHYEVRYHDKALNPKNFLRTGENVFQE